MFVGSGQPLSLRNTTNVSRSNPNSFNLLITRPSASSSATVIAASNGCSLSLIPATRSTYF